MFAITNVQVALPTAVVPNQTVLVSDGMIAEVSGAFSSGVSTEGIEIIDGNGQLLIPGMIDVHIHGAAGHDLQDGTVESIREVSRACARSGCTSFLATSVTSSLDDFLTMVENVKTILGSEPGAKIVGIHMEGPYLNAKRKGMQKEAHLRSPDAEEIALILEATGSLLKLVTIAPELPGGEEAIRQFQARGVIVSMGHSDATYELAKAAFDLGVTHVTHCFNALRPIHHRDPGAILAALEDGRVTCEAIVDHTHLHPAIVRLLHRNKGRERMVLITDAMQAMGLGDGEYVFGGHEVRVDNGVATLADGTLASSTVTMNQALRKTVECGIPLVEAVTMATRTPADELGLRGKGRVEPGADADLVLLDEEFNVIWTMIGGKRIDF